MELREQREQWRLDRNKRRKLAYHVDPDHRSKINQRNRNYYGAEKREIPANLATYAKTRPVEIYGAVSDFPTLSVVELAHAWGYHPVAVYRWVGDGRLPKPDIVNREPGKGVAPKVYTLKKAQRMTDVLRKHLSENRHYRLTDTDVILNMNSDNEH